MYYSRFLLICYSFFVILIAYLFIFIKERKEAKKSIQQNRLKYSLPRRNHMTQKREEIHFRTIFLTTFSSSRVLTRSHTESPAFESAGNEDSSRATKMSQLHTFGQQADWIFLDGKYFLLPNVDHRQQRRIKERKILTVSAAERLRCRV